LDPDFRDKLIIGLISAIISGAVAVFISTWIFRKNETRKTKLDVLRKLMGYRYDFDSKEFAESINCLFIVFYKSKDVIRALKEFHEAVTSINRDNELVQSKLLELFKMLFKDLDINTDPLSDKFFLTPFQKR